MRNKIRWIDRTVIQSGVYIGLCVTEKQLLKELQRLKCNLEFEWPCLEQAVTHTLSSKNKSMCIVCLNADEKDRAWTCSALVHEAVHVYQRAMEHMGEDDPGDEIEAYAIQNIFIGLSLAYEKMCAENAKQGGE